MPCLIHGTDFNKYKIYIIQEVKFKIKLKLVAYGPVPLSQMCFQLSASWGPHSGLETIHFLPAIDPWLRPSRTAHPSVNRILGILTVDSTPACPLRKQKGICVIKRQTCRHRKQSYGCQRGKAWRRDKLRVWN